MVCRRPANEYLHFDASFRETDFTAEDRLLNGRQLPTVATLSEGRRGYRSSLHYNYIATTYSS